MVCSPHQYTLQRIATPYLPAAAYVEQKNYLQTPAYQVRPQQELYRARKNNFTELSTYRPRQQYAKQYQTQNDERQRSREENIQFTAPVWTPAKIELPPSIPEPPVSSTWNDYGLPLYSTPRIVKEISELQPEQKVKRDDLLQLIQQEIAAMNIMNTEKRMEDYLCAAQKTQRDKKP